jgi:DNA-binding NtrC family response regulator
MTRILVVDDDAELRETVTEVLNGEGFETTSIGDAESALNMLVDPGFDLVLLDLIMPGMGGMTAVPLMKKGSPQTRIIMISAFSTVSNAVEAMRLGADDYITKPFKIEDLLTAVRQNIEEARLNQCRTVLDVDGAFNSLSNVTRRQIIGILKENQSLRFMEIARSLEIEDHTKVNFHLKMLKESEVITQDENRAYILSDFGHRVAECLTMFVNTLKS